MSTSSPSAASKKRTAEQLGPLGTEPTKKIAKIHPFFAKKAEPTPAGPFRWLEPLGPTRSCLHGVNLSPTPSTKVAAFDLDGTLIKSIFDDAKKPLAPTSWEWWRASVPAKLKDVFDSGYAVVIVSNQALKPQALKTWKLKIPLVAEALRDVPFRLFAATAKDGYRKPMPGMWSELERIFREDGVEIDKANSFFVGDAGGRQYAGNKTDFSSTDRKWALNIGIPFFTPEEYFLHLPTHTKYSLPGFHVSSLAANLSVVTPTSTPLLPAPLEQELVLFVGYPCMGKTSFYRRHFEPAGYVHINQDTLKTRDRCVKEAQKALIEGKSCVVDNTNRDVATRKYYIDIARQLKVMTRCFLFDGSIELAWHNNLYRAYNLPPSIAATEPKRELVPYMAFTGFRDKFEEPQPEEGFTEIKRVHWIFNGTAEETRYWSMWLQIDGK
ncbi:putative PNK3P-domain-containing protein [Lyophyllum shimeji]|uniref:PNK3P-domain-containing protein n=1 Tax=Lyophyllum shimeji TaxID=47721 RepID=A0A9P3PFT6_LYOSH|nr:putative PNK3P-domain-containing protein [Lyophyllum shimeji]